MAEERLWLLKGSHRVDGDDGEPVNGSGYELVDEDGWTRRRYELELQDAIKNGAAIIKVAGVSHRPDHVKKQCFTPGRSVHMRPDDDNEYDPNAVGVWDADGRFQCGFVPRDDAPAVRRLLEQGPWESKVLWQWRKGQPSQRVGLQILLHRPQVLAGEAPDQLRRLARSRMEQAPRASQAGERNGQRSSAAEPVSGSGCATVMAIAALAAFILWVIL